MKIKDINEGLFKGQNFPRFLQTQFYFLDQARPSHPMSYFQAVPRTLTFYFLS